MAELPTFSEFYVAVHGGRGPFPWQSRLADRVAEHGWPREIGVPTGLGKTSAIDIAVWSLAAQADRDPRERSAPTRIWYVVNRRLLVDAASDHAAALSDLLIDPPPDHPGREVLAAVAARLRSIAGGTAIEPLFVSRLRGGAMQGARPLHPAQPAVLCATVPMFGSRLLFRSYGSSNRMWPIDAALAGIDSLVLLDEAHLSPALQSLVEIIPDSDSNRTGVLRAPGRFEPKVGPAALVGEQRAYPVLVSLTATGTASDRFDLDDLDRDHPLVRQRLHASKPTRLVTSDRRRLAADLAATTVEMLSERAEPCAALVFANSPKTAREVRAALMKGSDLDPLVLTGRLREVDAEAVRARLLDPVTGAPAGVGAVARDRHLVVIATQTLEVGADVDFDILVTESAGVRAITQRFGRLNRLGAKPAGRGAIVHPADATAGLYGDEPARLWERLEAHRDDLDLGPASIASACGSPADAPPRIPELLPAHLWEFAKTSSPPLGAAPPEVFFAGIEEPALTVNVVWRAAPPTDGSALVPSLSASEAVDVPVGELRSFLADSGAQAWSLAVDGAIAHPLDPDDLRPGMTVVLPVSAGGYGPHGWDPSEGCAVTDLSPLLGGAVHLSAVALANLAGDRFGEEQAALLDGLAHDPEDGPDPAADATVGEAIFAWLAGLEAPAELVHRWRLGDASAPTVDRVGPGLDPVLSWIIQDEASKPARVDALDELSIGSSTGLYAHLADVGDVAARVASALGFPTDVAAAVAEAGRFHDLGKADARFQAWLGASPGDLRAKSGDISSARWERNRHRSGWPRGGRHELLSVQLLNAAIAAGVVVADPDLVRHLVLSHHGLARPLSVATDDGAGLRTEVLVGDRTVLATTDPRVQDWGQPDRFRDACERFGLWGLALLEAVVRQSDHAASAAIDRRGIRLHAEVL